MALFQYSIDIQGSLEEDYKNNIESKIQKPIRAGLKALDSDMRYMLQNYIQTNVYDVYHPDDYNRRDGRAYSMSNMNYSAQTDFISYNIMRFSYNIDGVHADNGGAYYENGDDIINVIEKGKECPYPWGVDGHVNSRGETLGPRPFWTPFITELFDYGQAEFSFIKGFNANNNGIGTLTFDDSLELSSSDDYIPEWHNSLHYVKSADNDNADDDYTDELPF